MAGSADRKGEVENVTMSSSVKVLPIRPKADGEGVLARLSGESPDPGRARRLMIVVPAFNEEGSIGTVIAELRALELPGMKVGFVIVDDGSKDATREVARALGAEVLSLPFNMGIGVTVQTGFRYALSRGAELVAQVDGDCQHIPAELSRLLPLIQGGEADVAIGSRFQESRSDGIRASTFTRWLVGRVLAFTIRLLTGMRISDTTSGFRVFNRRAAAYVANNYPDDYPEVEILVPLACQGFKVSETPVRMRPRAAGRSSINWHRAVYYVLKVVLASLFSRVR